MSVLFHLYSSEGCHLCELAQALILKSIPDHQFKIIDIVNDEFKGLNLIELYGVHIPVFERISDGAKLFWPFEQTQVVELI